MSRILYRKDYTSQGPQLYWKDVDIIGRIIKEYPEWKRQLEYLDRDLAGKVPSFSSRDPFNRVLFQLILAKCDLHAEVLGGTVTAVESSIPDLAFITLQVPYLSFRNDGQEGLLRWLGRCCWVVAIFPDDDGIRIEIEVPYYHKNVLTE